MNIVDVLMKEFAGRPEVKEIWVLGENEQDDNLIFRAVFDLIPAEGKKLSRATKYIDVTVSNEIDVWYQNHRRDSCRFDIMDPQSLVVAEGFVRQTLGATANYEIAGTKDFHLHIGTLPTPDDDLWDENEAKVKVKRALDFYFNT